MATVTAGELKTVLLTVLLATGEVAAVCAVATLLSSVPLSIGAPTRTWKVTVARLATPAASVPEPAQHGEKTAMPTALGAVPGGGSVTALPLRVVEPATYCVPAGGVSKSTAVVVSPPSFVSTRV